MEEKLHELERSKNDSNRYYQILRVLNRDKSKIPLCVHDKDGNITGQHIKTTSRNRHQTLPENACTRKCSTK